MPSVKLRSFHKLCIAKSEGKGLRWCYTRAQEAKYTGVNKGREGGNFFPNLIM
jgi:hypothetical protein